MRNVLTIWRRELAACFLSPIAYVTMVVFLAACGATFMAGVMRNLGGSEPLSTLLVASTVIWLTALVTVITMRLFAEERKSGTLETLMTAPVLEREIVLGKYLGAFTFLLAVMTPAFANVFILAAFSPAIQALDLGAIGGGVLVMILFSGFLLAVGMVISLVTANQIIAAVVCFTVLWVILLFGWLASSLPFGEHALVTFLSPATHIDDFARGAIDTRVIVFYISITVFLLFTATRMLESRRWR